MACDDIDHEELLVRTGYDALPDSGSDLVDQCFSGVDQLLHFDDRELTECVFDQVSIIIDLRQVLDALDYNFSRL